MLLGDIPPQMLAPDGEAGGSVATLRAELAEARARLSAVLEGATETAIIATDASGCITLFNAGAERMLGYAAEEVVGRVTPALFHLPSELAVCGVVEAFDDEAAIMLAADPGEDPALRAPDPANGFETIVAHATQGGFDNRDWTYVRKDGTHLTVSLAVTAVREHDGAITGYLAIGSDVTAQRQITEELQRARAMADEANRAKSSFLATMSHEIRTPMNGVLGFTSLLLETPLDEEQRMFLNTIDRSGRDLLALIDDILDFSKIEAGRLELENGPFDLRLALTDAASLLSGKASNKGLSFRTHFDHTMPHRVEGDVRRFKQVLFNLLGNAVKFTDNGTVALMARRLGVRGQRIEIIDTGIGIAPEEQRRLFTRFTQADNSITRRYGGTGLGLAICKQLVELMGGRIGIDSAPGRGSTFWFELALPEVESEAPPGEAAPAAVTGAAAGEGGNRAGDAPAPLPPLPPLQVLIVDDNPVNRMLAQRLVEKLGCPVTTANDGLEAYERVMSERFDIVLMDCHMPVLDGFEATRRLRAVERERALPRLPVVAMTAGALDEDRRQCHDAGMDDHLPKPIRAADLAAALRRWCVKTPV